MEKGESVAEGAARELLEESCLKINWWNFLDDAQTFVKKKMHLELHLWVSIMHRGKIAMV